MKLEDIKVGMRVNTEDLYSFAGVAFILTDFVGDEGVIKYIGEPYTDEACAISKEIRTSGRDICIIYEPYDGEEVDSSVS